MFQFHKGAIKTFSRHQENDTIFRFNSIKVRLRRDLFDDPKDAVIAFQFHKGAIKTSASGSPP